MCERRRGSGRDDAEGKKGWMHMVAEGREQGKGWLRFGQWVEE